MHNKRQKLSQEYIELAIQNELNLFKNWEVEIVKMINNYDFYNLNTFISESLFQGFEDELWDSLIVKTVQAKTFVQILYDIKKIICIDSTYKAMRVFSAFYSPGKHKNLKDVLNYILKLSKENPGMVGIVSNGDKYSYKLIEVFDGFDEHAKESIRRLTARGSFKNRDIYNIDIRRSQINNLSGFARNKGFTTWMSHENPSQLSNWLFYPETIEFLLQNENGIPVMSERIRTPINRITTENFRDVHGALKTLANNFKSKDFIPLEKDETYGEILQKISLQEKAIRESEDQKKTAGMQKGLENLLKQRDNYKPKQLNWYFNGVADSLMILKNDISKSLSKLDELKQQDKNRSVINQIKQLDADIISKIQIFVERLRDALQSVNDLSVVKMDTELMNHLNSDILDIVNSLNEKVDSSNLEGREITIGICNRNPNISLFLGNYTNCCVSIEDPNNIHEDEPPILDYLTDLGMQLVVASDTTNPDNPVPVAVAWTYIGKGGKMVIDNIEANNTYVGQFGTQFTKEMKKYMEAYAEACELTLVQGTSNNDLTIAPSGDGVEKTFHNRKDGYYLEAEGS
jgi:hypothetical protein